CFLSTCVTAPIKPVALGFPALGQDMDVLGSDGEPVRGEVGELVCRRPWPGMTRGIWGDPERYLDTYWRRFPGVWTHGDWASIDEDGYWFLHGRSDDTLNIAGKRIGPAELESAAVSHPAVSEAAAIGVPHELKGEVPWLFCVLAPGVEPGDTLGREVAKAVIAELGPAFKPERIFFVEALPRTRSAKIVRRAVRASALGTDPGDLRAADRTLTSIAAEARDVVALVGAPLYDGDLFNACAVCAGGEVRAYARKRFLPNYGVFDEHRYFAAGREPLLLDLGGTLVG